MARQISARFVQIGMDLRSALRRVRSAILETNHRALAAKVLARHTRTAERRLQIPTLEGPPAESPGTSVPGFGQRIGSAASPVVSVIMPTRNRAHVIAEAIASVKAQHFADWELIIVDNGSSDDTVARIAPYLADARIRCVSWPTGRESAARNRGLELARGILIAYLDSDNVWYPDFLAAAVDAFAADPAADLVYGILVSDAHQLDRARLLWAPFDRDRLLSGNFIDLNVAVHRKRLVERYGDFDEKLDRLSDWDLILRYTEHAPARAVPVLGALYRVCDDIRVSCTRPRGPNEVAIKRKWFPAARAKRRPRVLYALWQHPQLSESYVETEIRCMLRWGVHVEVWRENLPYLSCVTAVPVHDGLLADAVRRVRPDVVHIHWLTFASMHERTLAALGLPVTLRLHGFEVTPKGLRDILKRRWVRSIHAFPHHLKSVGRADSRLRALPSAFDTTLFRPHAQKDRRLVIRTSAALPSKDLPFFLELAKRLPDHRFVLAAATCAGAERYVDELRSMRRDLNSPAELLFDVPHEDLAALVAQAGIYVHTAKPPGTRHATPIGMPISIAEAMATGAHVLVGDIAELRAYVGDAGTAYRDLDHAAQIIAGIAARSEQAWSRSWLASVERAFAIHADEVALRPLFEDWCAMVKS